MTSAEYRRLAGRANRGRSFEDDLERTNEWYLRKGLAAVRRNPREWVYTSVSDRQRILLKTTEITAKCDNGRVLVARKSKVDFEGNFGSRYIAFDAKETAGRSLPLKNISRHQVKQLLEHEKTGGLAGFMIRFSELDVVYFLRTSAVEAVRNSAIYRGGKKSIALLFCESQGVHIRKANGLIDWAADLR